MAATLVTDVTSSIATASDRAMRTERTDFIADPKRTSHGPASTFARGVHPAGWALHPFRTSCSWAFDLPCVSPWSAVGVPPGRTHKAMGGLLERAAINNCHKRLVGNLQRLKVIALGGHYSNK